MTESNVLVFESAAELKMYKVGAERSVLQIDSAKGTVLQADSTTVPAASFEQWDSIKDRLIPV